MKLVDVRGRRCPLLLADLTREMRGGAAGHTIEVLADSPTLVESLLKWCREKRHKLISVDEIEGDLRVAIRKGKTLH
jgi:TusA-related sulfurtransferase